MTKNRVFNAFQIVRPRGATAAPARQPIPRGRTGRPMATLAPRIYGGGPVLSRAQSQAQNDKTRAIVKGGI